MGYAEDGDMLAWVRRLEWACGPIREIEHGEEIESGSRTRHSIDRFAADGHGRLHYATPRRCSNGILK